VIAKGDQPTHRDGWVGAWKLTGDFSTSTRPQNKATADAELSQKTSKKRDQWASTDTGTLSSSMIEGSYDIKTAWRMRQAKKPHRVRHRAPHPANQRISCRHRDRTAEKAGGKSARDPSRVIAVLNCSRARRTSEVKTH